MNDIALAQAVQAAVKPKFHGNAVLKSKVVTHSPANLAAEYETITTAYMRLFHQTLKEHLPTIRRAIDAERAGIAAEPDVWLEHAKQEERDSLAAAVRARRDALLFPTDKTQMPDADIADCCRDAFRVYRQALRDIPEQPGFPYEVEWPDAPVMEKAAQ